MRINPDKTTLSNNRWAKYAAAGAAGAVAALGPQVSVDADFTFVEVGAIISGGQSTLSSFGSYTFGDSNAGFLIRHVFLGTDGVLLAYARGNAVMAGQLHYGSYYYPSNIAYNAFISTAGNFTPGIIYTSSFGQQGQMAWGTDTSCCNYLQFTDPGLAFLGFQFDVGNGTQYGFAEFMLDGQPDNTGVLVGYGWGMAGDQVFAGQRGGVVIPEPGSLGMLALGSLGLMTWRRKRAAA